MALSANEYTYTGGAQTFPVNFELGFIDREDIFVRINDAVDGSGEPVFASFTWIDDSNITVDDPLMNGDIVQIRRIVSKTELQVDFEDNADVTTKNLNDQALQSLMIYQELLDGFVGLSSPADDADRAEEAAARAEAAAGNYRIFATRPDFVLAAPDLDAEIGQVVAVGDVLFVYRGSTVIADLPGWHPFISVFPDHWVENIVPGVTPMQDAISDADAYATSNDMPLRGLRQYGTASRITLNAARVSLKLKVLEGFTIIEDGGYEANYVVRAGASVAADELVDWDIEVDGDDQMGSIKGGWDPSKPWEGGITTADATTLGEQNNVTVSEVDTGPRRNTAYKIIPTAVSGGHHVGTDVAVTAGQVYGVGCYVKADEYPGVELFFESTGFAGGKQAVFDASNNAWSSVHNDVGYYSVDLGKGWYWIGAWTTATDTDDARLLARVVDDSLSPNFSGNGASGVIIADFTEGLFEGPFPARWSDEDERDFPVTSLTNGQRARIWEVGSTDFTSIGASENSSGIVFTATGAGTGTGEVTTIADFPVLAGDYFPVVWPTNVNGEEFLVHDALAATVDNPDASTFGGNWRKQDRIAGLLIQGVATPHSRFAVSVSNFDTALAVRGNSERIFCDVSAAYCTTALWESYNDAGTGTPDSNTYRVRTSSVAQVYANADKPLSEIYFNCQSTLSRCFDLPFILDQGGRTRGMFGNIRTPASYASFRGNGVDSSWKFNLSFENAGNARSHIRNKSPIIVIDTAEYLHGEIMLDQPIDGFWIKNSGQATNISLMAPDMAGGTALILGETATSSPAQGSFKVTATGNAESVFSEYAANCEVAYFGTPRKLTHQRGTGAEYILPAAFVGNDIEIDSNITTDPVFRFRGARAFSEFAAYTYPTVGMRGDLSDFRNQEVFYNGTTWLKVTGEEDDNWIPALSGGGVSISLSSAEARYIRIGKLVVCQGRVVVSNLNGASGAVDIENLPFPSRNFVTAGGGTVVQATDLDIVAGNSLTVQVLSNTSSARILIYDASTGTSNFRADDLVVGSQLRFAFSYETA